MLIGQEAENTPNLNRAHWTVTFGVGYTSDTVVPVPTSSSAEQQHSSSTAAASAAADRVVKALRRDEVRDAEEEVQRQEEYTDGTSTYSGDYVAAAPAKQICRLQSAKHGSSSSSSSSSSSGSSSNSSSRKQPTRQPELSVEVIGLRIYYYSCCMSATTQVNELR